MNVSIWRKDLMRGFKICSSSNLLRKNLLLILLADIVLLVLCYISAFAIRFEGSLPPDFQYQIETTLLPLVAIKICCFFMFDLYRGMWRYAGIRDLLNIGKGALAGAFIFIIYLAMVHHFNGVSRGVILIDMLLTILCIGGLRLIIRLYYQRESIFVDELMFWRKSLRGRKNILIIGTGPRAEKLMRELHENSRIKYQVIGFVDMGNRHRGMKIHGIPILGSELDLPQLVSFYGIEDILIADSDLNAKDISSIVEMCGNCGVRFKVIPSLSERMNQGESDALRDIKLEDLMDREPVRLDMEMVRAEIEGQTILVTGAGGSIGSELCRQILRYNPGKLVLIDNAETPLYQIDMELNSLKKPGTGTEVIPCIGDVRSRRSLERIFRRYKPEYVYHAAAYKHVPMMELSPIDAINNNIMGTFKLATLACRYHVKKFVLISTDKAVRPTSVMGATKRIAELVVQTISGNGTRFVVVRFGNVLGSNGSVVPLFQQQIASGGPVTVTHPEVTRYFMTIPEAVMLVLQSGSIGKGGELFLLDMGKQVKIADLARNMIRLSGLVPDRDIKIEYIGLRPGEKLYEELLIDGEGVIDTAYEKIKVCNTCSRVDERDLFEGIEHFSLLVKNSGDSKIALKILERLIPDFKRENIPDSGTPSKPYSPEHKVTTSYREI
jgi:FlaA1/EpsC-like NDP-sugar epimerase